MSADDFHKEFTNGFTRGHVLALSIYIQVTLPDSQDKKECISGRGVPSYTVGLSISGI